ncbi:30S ribosomal protein S11, chloroplastic [Nymphaea colorata]|uniref:30S ribosomal protein S11, chloroplastic n=1 Tax=Nymphaea colorata TaxID=210225 RepID=UPI00129E7F27|nr:30S ribosomal protein S11, chloroplastic [Nymphaea colorata]
MIQPQTFLNVADNSGARKLMCIRIIGASNYRYAHIGDVIVAVIKEAVPNMPLERSEVIRAVIVRTCKELKRDNEYDKPIPRIGSRRNSRISSRKSGCRTPIGVIHVQASFNNTIVTVQTHKVGSFLGLLRVPVDSRHKKGTPFAAQTAAGNAIRAVVDQGMQRAEVMIKGPGLGEMQHYERFVEVVYY